MIGMWEVFLRYLRGICEIFGRDMVGYDGDGEYGRIWFDMVGHGRDMVRYGGYGRIL
jgi:hypothetical protein